MKKLIFVLLSLIVVVPLFSTEINKESLEDFCLKLSEKHSVKFIFDTTFESVETFKWKKADNHDYEKLFRYLKFLDEEFSLYPETLLKNSGLMEVFVVKQVSVQNQLRTAIPDIQNLRMIYDFIRGDYAPVYQKHVIHHEFFHFLDYQLTGTWKDPQWEELNEREFKYGDGGETMQNNSNSYEFVHPRKGFVNLYSQSGVEEDKAELFAGIFIKEEWLLINKWLKTDTILEDKINFLKNILQEMEIGFTEEYWKKITGRGKTPFIPSPDKESDE